MMEKKVYKQGDYWCYDILTEIGDLLIKQDTKPAVGGTNGFKTKEEAENIANLVIALMDADLSPSVTIAHVTNAKNINIAEEIKAVKAAIEGAKDAPKPKNLQ